jgi:replicative superfamily II helicase
MLSHVDFLSDDPDVTSSEADQYSQTLKSSPPSEMELLGIPAFLQDSYLAGTPPPAITALRPWQSALFRTGAWEQRQNCLVVVPTAAGKTVAAEVAIAQLLARDPNARAIYCLPFVSLAAEKYSEFVARFPKIVVRPFYANVGGPEFSRGSIAIATYEKAHALINIAQRKHYLDRISLVVIDEIHMIGDESRGANVEALIAKLKLPAVGPQIIALSATVSAADAAEIGRWLGGFVFQRDDRPSGLEYLTVDRTGLLRWLFEGKSNDGGETLTTIPADKTFLLPVIARAFRKSMNSSVLLFVNTRRETRSTAKFIAKYLYSFSQFDNLPAASEELLSERRRLIDAIGRRDDSMAQCLIQGVAFHHAGLLLEERTLIECAVRQGTLNVVVATTTLSAGINIANVSTVIIENVYRQDGGGQSPLRCAQFCQMAGRAGRVESQSGDVIVIQHTAQSQEAGLIAALSRGNPGRIVSHLFDPPELDRYWLQCLHFFGPSVAERFADASYAACADHPAKLAESTRRLAARHLIVSERRLSPLGRAIATANLGIAEGLAVYEKLKQASAACRLCDDLHLLYVCMPADLGFTTPSYREEIWEKIRAKHADVFSLTVGLTESAFQRLITLAHRDGPTKENNEDDGHLDQFYGACALLAVIEEQRLAQVERDFAIERGTIEALQTATATLAGQICKFCELGGFAVLGAAIHRFRRRLNYAVKNELLDLMSLRSCTRGIARLLFTHGVEDSENLARRTVDEIAALIGGEGEMGLAKQLKEEAQRVSEFKQRSQEFEEEMQLTNFSEVLGSQQ